MARVFTIIVCLIVGTAQAQTLGGNSTYNFLKLPSTPLLTAVGGVNTSFHSNEVGMTANNPALLNASLHSHLNASFNLFPGTIKTYSLTGAYHHEQSNTSFGGQIFFLDYGTLPQTDAAGNILGNFRPSDYMVQLSAGKRYLESWHYGASVRFIHSNYLWYRSSALALDFSVLFADSSRKLFASVLAKNMGMQLTTYAGEGEDIPFDLQLGITKRLSKAPFAFSLTAQQVHRFNLLYNDTTFNTENDFPDHRGFFNKLFNHLVLATHIFIGNHLEASAGYNRLRRQELNIGTTANGLNGFSMGLRVNFSKLQVLLARSHYQRNIAYNQVGLTVHLNRLVGGKGL